MTFSVVWALAALQEATRVEQAAADPARVRAAQDRIDFMLRRYARDMGESRNPGFRVWYEDVLGMRLFKTQEMPGGGQHFFLEMGNGVDGIAFFWWPDAKEATSGDGVSGAYDDDMRRTGVGGTAIASYMNDGGTDLAPNFDLSAEAVRSVGWLAYYNRAWSDAFSSSIGYSQHKQDNTDGQLGNAFRRGSYASANVLFSFAKNVTTGLEYVWGKLETKDGSSAPDYRLQFSTKVTF